MEEKKSVTPEIEEVVATANDELEENADALNELSEESISEVSEESVDEVIEQEENVQLIQNEAVSSEVRVDAMPDLVYAGFGKRFWAYLIDLMVGYAIATSMFGVILAPLVISVNPRLDKVVITFFVLLYFTLTTYFNGGQTLGKMIYGLRVVELHTENKGKLRFTTVLVREFFIRYLHLLSILPMLYILTAFTKKKQNLLDLFADTAVIDEQKERIYELGQMSA